jgi:hypothetical protein
MNTAPVAGTENAAAHVLQAAPRLIKVTAATAISFGLWEGAHRVLLHAPTAGQDAHEIANGYCGVCALMTVVRLALLLDDSPKVVSFQSVYKRLQRTEVVNVLTRRLCAESPLPACTHRDIRHSVSRFLDTYKAIDWHDLHGRLKHFRNRGVAHLDLKKIEKRITGDELRSLVYSVTILGECLEPFASDVVPVRQDEIEDWGDRAAAAWRTATRGRGGSNLIEGRGIQQIR